MVMRAATTLFDSLSRLRMKALDTEEEFRTFYVPASEARNAEEQDRTKKTLLSIQTAEDPCHILFSGHLGCGKSTELRRLGRMLEEEHFLAGVGVCEGNLDMNTVKYFEYNGQRWVDLHPLVMDWLNETRTRSHRDVDIEEGAENHD